MSAASLVPDVASFESPLDFLRAVVASEKAARPDFSLEKTAARFGMSRSGFSMILSGTRSLTLPQIHAVARGLKLDKDTHEFWECMVLAAQAELPIDAEIYEARLGRLKSARSTFSVRTPSAHLVSAWYVPAILVYLIDIAAGDAAPETLAMDIAKALRLEESQVALVIDRLAAEGFLQFKGRGNIHVSFDRLAASVSSKRFLKDVLKEAAARIDAAFEDRRNFFTSHAFSLAKADIPSIVRDYKALMEEYVSRKPADTAPREVVVTAFQLFPVLAKG